MAFTDGFSSLEPSRIEQAHANVSGDLLLLASGTEVLTNEKVEEMFGRIEAASPGYLAVLGKQEEAIQMIGSIPGMVYGHERYSMIQMTLGFLGAGLILAEYVRLESEEA